MSNKTFNKNKKREKESKKKVLAKRNVIRAKAKMEDNKEREKREAQRISNKIEGKTIRIRPSQDATNQLKHNLQILEALQKEQELLEEAQKNAPQLSTEGVPMAQAPQGGGLSASADVVFIPNPLPEEESKQETEKEESKEEKTNE